jgi:hypothetical protein
MSSRSRVIVGAALGTGVFVAIVAPILWVGDYFVVRLLSHIIESVGLLGSNYTVSHDGLMWLIGSAVTAVLAAWMTCWFFRGALQAERDLAESDGIGADRP